MKPSNYEKAFLIIKFTEFGLLGFGAYYATTSSLNLNVWIFVGIYLLLFILTLVDMRFSKLGRSNLNLLVRYFYEQNYFDPKDDVRITIHKKINDKIYEQYIDYYPSGACRGKKHQIVKGIVRYAFTTANGEFTENFNSIDEKMKCLVSKYNYRREEAIEQVKDGEMSYYCCPIINNNKVWGVIYIKSSQASTFPDSSKIEGSSISKNINALKKLIENEI